MKKLLLSICAIIISAAAWAESVTFDFDANYAKLFPTLKGTSSSSGDNKNDGDFTATTTATLGNFTFTVEPSTANNANRIWNSSPRLRIYSASFTIASKGEAIKYIKFNAGSNFNISSVSTGTLTDKEWTGSAQEIKFNVSKNTQISSVEISTEGGTVVLDNLYSVDFKSSQEGWTIDNKSMDEALSRVWYVSTSFGYCASGYLDSDEANHAAESWLISPAFDLTNATSAQVSFNHAANKFNGAVTDQLALYATTDGGTNWTKLTVDQWPTGTSWGFVTGTADIKAYQGKSPVQFAIAYKSTTASAGTYEISDFKIKGFGSASIYVDRTIPQITPETGTYDTDQTVTLVDPSGNGYTIYYTLNGTDPDESSLVYTAPFTVSTTTTVKAVLVDDDDNMSDVITSVITIDKPAEYTTIAQLLDNTTATSSSDAPTVCFKFTDLLVTGVNGSNVFVSDNTGTFLLYGASSSLSRGDKISGNIKGKLYAYNNLPEITVTDKWANITTTSTDNTVEPVKVDPATITKADASQFVQFKGVSYVSSETVSGKENYTFTDGTTSIVVRDNFSNLSKKGFTADKKYDLNVFVVPFKESIQYYAVRATDVTEATTVSQDVNGDGNADTQDVLQIYDYMQNSDSTTSPAEDVNGDGQVDTQDVLDVYDYIRIN